MTPTASLREEKYSSLADKAYASIRDMLIMLDIRPNEPLDDDALAEQLEMGKTPVREAIKRLEVDRLIITYPRRGTFATGVDITDLAHISEVRNLLEPLAAQRAAERASSAERQEMLDLADRLEELDLATTSNYDLMAYDAQVHRVVYRVAGNPHLEDALVRHHNLATRIFCLFLDRLPPVDSHVREHVELLRTIAAGDAAKASLQASEHVKSFEVAVRSVI
ncbi:GntR family transcriptional regulator [Quadrisphaera granulorum]|uniref:GntR family transcriptional regulator n=1 Tax=Quadrisphaera granulorum TaxID=317664 RepID=UPI001B85C25C|nr:GntR family transcriptional regulator [Quadrisphaera granulorum]